MEHMSSDMSSMSSPYTYMPCVACCTASLQAGSQRAKRVSIEPGSMLSILTAYIYETFI
jgi:hypothetical protein